MNADRTIVALAILALAALWLASAAFRDLNAALRRYDAARRKARAYECEIELLHDYISEMTMPRKENPPGD